MSNTVTSNAYWRKLYVQVVDMFDKLVARPDPHTSATPFDVPSHRRRVGGDRPSGSRRRARYDHRAVPARRRQRRPGSGVPAGAQRREPRSATSRDVVFKGTWSRFEQRPTRSRYLWLRDGAPLPQYNGAPIGSKPECGAGPRQSSVRDPAGGRGSPAQLPGHRVTTTEDGPTTQRRDGLDRGRADTRRDAPGTRTTWMALQVQVDGMGLAACTDDRADRSIDQIVIDRISESGERLRRSRTTLKALDRRVHEPQEVPTISRRS